MRDYVLNIQTLVGALIDRYSFAQTSYHNLRIRVIIYKHEGYISLTHPKVDEI